MLNSTRQIILVCKILQNMNFNGLTFLTALVLYSQSDYLNHSNRNSGWLYWSVLYESVKHADDTVFALKINFVLKIESNSWGI